MDAQANQKEFYTLEEVCEELKAWAKVNATPKQIVANFIHHLHPALDIRLNGNFPAYVSPSRNPVLVTDTWNITRDKGAAPALDSIAKLGSADFRGVILTSKSTAGHPQIIELDPEVTAEVSISDILVRGAALAQWKQFWMESNPVLNERGDLIGFKVNGCNFSNSGGRVGGSEAANKGACEEENKPWLTTNPDDPETQCPWYTPARYFARELLKHKPNFKRSTPKAFYSAIADKLFEASFYPRNNEFTKDNKPNKYDLATVRKALNRTNIG